MRRLPVPQFNASDVYTCAIRAFDDASLRVRLQGALTVVLNEEAQYRCLAQSGRLDLVKRSETVTADPVGHLSVAEMKELYKKGMSSASGSARSFYDKLMAEVPHETCPLCGQGKVRNLDHHLPQSQYPSLVVTPINLVPSCRDCNAAKLSTVPKAIGEQTIHPYFDDVTGARWLHAIVAESDPPVILYEVRLPEGWSQVTGDRLRRHMTVFKLAAFFTLYAGEELSQIAPELEDLHGKGGPSAVRQELLTMAHNRELIHRNSWQTAMYFGVAESEWFCADGLYLLRPTRRTVIAA